jgi:hypothetical protein
MKGIKQSRDKYCKKNVFYAAEIQLKIRISEREMRR